MALSPTDFVAFSRATGTPYPEDPEERAELAPQVLEFRRSQLQPKEEGPSLGNVLGAAALGLGAIAGGVLAAKQLGAKRAQVSASKIPQQGIESVERLATVNRQRAAEEITRQARAERMPGVVQADLSTVDRLLQDPELTSLVKQQEQEEAAELRSEMARQQARVQKVKREDLWNLVNEIRNETITADQAINALNSGEDQATGRIMRGAQRNEDLDLATVNTLAQQTGSADVATSLTPDGVPVDQVELLQPLTAQQMVESAKQEMIARRQSLEAAGMIPGTVRFERALAQPFRTSATEVVTGTKPIEFGLPMGPIKQTVESVGSQEPLIEKSVVNIGPQAVVTSTAAGTAIRGASPSYHEALPKQQLRQLYGTAEALVPGAPDELGLDLPGIERVRGVIPDVEPQFLSKQEIQYGVLDRPETPGPAGGSAGIGVYGLEPGYVPGAVSKMTGEYSEAASRKPTYVPGWLQKQQNRTGFESLTTPQLAAAAEKAQGPRIQAALEKEITQREVAKQSLEVSEVLRRGRIEGRDPQALLRQRGFNV